MGCGPGQPFGPTITPSPTITNTPTFTSTPTTTATFTPTSTATSTPGPVCKIGDTIFDAVDENIEYGQIDIVSVSTSLNGENLTVIFNLREIPNEITINQNEIAKGSVEYAWGVAIDIDDDLSTGYKPLFPQTGNGYEADLHTLYFKTSEEQKTDSIENLFRKLVSASKYTEDRHFLGAIGTGSIYVNIPARTLTLSGRIEGISQLSYLHFYTFYAASSNSRFLDELCER